MTNTQTAFPSTGARVVDANIAGIYGFENARVGTVLRWYPVPLGMVEVRWDATDTDDETTEDAWADELVAIHTEQEN